MALMMEEEERPLFNDTNNTRISNFSESVSLNVLVPLSGIYGIIFVTGILGNISTCIVIGRNRSMHTATNFYLFSLAISDLLLLLFGLPLEMHRLWNPLSYPLGESLCIAVGLISETSANATVVTITAFTVERYIAVCHPFMSRKISKLSRVVRYITAIWICAFCAALPQVIQFGIVTYKENEDTFIACTVKGRGVQQVFVLSSFIFFVAPMSLITVLYILIGVKLNTSSILHPVKRSSDRNREQSNGRPWYRPGASQRKIIRMLVVVALAFFLCWAPFHIQRLIAIYGKNLEQPTDFFYQIYTVLTLLSGVLYFLSTAINPFLYNIMSNKFRKAFKVTLSSCCHSLCRPQLKRTYRSLLATRKEQAAATVLSQPRHPRFLRRFSNASSQLYVAPHRAQSVNQSNFSIVNEASESWYSQKQSAKQSEDLTSPQSVSNSSLREANHEVIGEELATYLYTVNSKGEDNTWDTSV